MSSISSTLTTLWHPPYPTCAWPDEALSVPTSLEPCCSLSLKTLEKFWSSSGWCKRYTGKNWVVWFQNEARGIAATVSAEPFSHIANGHHITCGKPYPHMVKSESASAWWTVLASPRDHTLPNSRSGWKLCRQQQIWACFAVSLKNSQGILFGSGGGWVSDTQKEKLSCVASGRGWRDSCHCPCVEPPPNLNLH